MKGKKRFRLEYWSRAGNSWRVSSAGSKLDTLENRLAFISWAKETQARQAAVNPDYYILIYRIRDVTTNHAYIP